MTQENADERPTHERMTAQGTCLIGLRSAVADRAGGKGIAPVVPFFPALVCAQSLLCFSHQPDDAGS